MKDICLVVVTYNRLSNLRVTVAAARDSATDADILVVDNASSDGTKEWLMEQDDIFVLSHSENLGGAGGFASGMKWAFEKGYEWIWVMDDDVVPLPNGLNILLRYGQRFPCVQPSKLDSSGRVFEFEGVVHERSLRRSQLSHAKVFAETDHVLCNATCFEGLFLNRCAIEKVGYPDAHFFIGWDDIHYGMRLAREFPLVYIKEFCIQKQFDKEKSVAFGRRWFSSSPESRARHLRNMRRVIDIEQLGWQAHLQFVYEWLKAKSLNFFGVGRR